jgi:hypothetical protein
MNNKAQFTLVCTCEIVMRTGETLDSSLGDKPCSDISRIVLCPLHDAAPAMYEALREIVAAVGSGEVIDYSSAGDWYTDACAVLAQAEGRQA